MTIPDAAIGPVIAALVAATLSFLGLVVAKEQKVSEFRQAWIDAVRADLGEIIGSAIALLNIKTLGTEDFQAWKEVREDVVSGNAAMLRLRLRLNPKEAPSAALLVLLSQFEKVLDESRIIDDDALTALERDIIDSANGILKAEWKRVKRGEPIYWVAKWAALAILIVGGFLSFANYLHWLPSLSH